MGINFATRFLSSHFCEKASGPIAIKTSWILFNLAPLDWFIASPTAAHFLANSPPFSCSLPIFCRFSQKKRSSNEEQVLRKFPQWCQHYSSLVFLHCHFRHFYRHSSKHRTTGNLPLLTAFFRNIFFAWQFWAKLNFLGHFLGNA